MLQVARRTAAPARTARGISAIASTTSSSWVRSSARAGEPSSTAYLIPVDAHASSKPPLAETRTPSRRMPRPAASRSPMYEVDGAWVIRPERPCGHHNDVLIHQLSDLASHNPGGSFLPSAAVRAG